MITLSISLSDRLGPPFSLNRNHWSLHTITAVPLLIPSNRSVVALVRLERHDVGSGAPVTRLLPLGKIHRVHGDCSLSRQCTFLVVVLSKFILSCRRGPDYDYVERNSCCNEGLNQNSKKLSRSKTGKTHSVRSGIDGQTVGGTDDEGQDDKEGVHCPGLCNRPDDLAEPGLATAGRTRGTRGPECLQLPFDTPNSPDQETLKTLIRDRNVMNVVKEHTGRHPVLDSGYCEEGAPPGLE